MQRYGLTVDKFLDHAATWHGGTDIVSVDAAGTVERTSYAEVRGRANRLSGALAALGVAPGDRVGTLAWNTRHHLETYYAVMGMGAVCHTLNPRLTAAQLAAMVDEAEDRVLAVAVDLLPLAMEVVGASRTVAHLIVLDGSVEGRTGTVAVHGIERLLAEHGAPHPWGAFDEESAAGLCYTSGTTGRPKGVVYTHRSNYLHTLRALQADAVALTARDTLLLAVPMFHANGWGLPFAAPAAGTRLVLPGRNLDGASLARLIAAEGVTVAVGVQTVWLGVADALDRTGDAVPTLKRVLIGGSACPEALLARLQDRLGARVQTSWGMTELSPIGTMASPGEAAPAGSAGRPPIGVDLKLFDAAGAPLPEQRDTLGHLKVKGPSVVARYFRAEADAVDADGWFDTGDLATIDRAGNLTIQGRAKDLIKSGGEWINPAEMEAIVGAHPAVRHVAVIARADPKWGERPVMVVESDEADVSTLAQLLRGRVADWWIPKEIVRVAAMPLAATGKIDKQRLRAAQANGELDALAA